MVYANCIVNKEYVNFQAICEAILFLYLSGTITGLLQKIRMFSSQWTLKAFYQILFTEKKINEWWNGITKSNAKYQNNSFMRFMNQFECEIM